MKKPTSIQTLTDLGRVRLSKSFFMRDFLFSDIASIHGLNNVPDEPDLALAAGTRLCEELLEPLQDRFGRIATRSAFRSEEVNFAAHIWDRRDADGFMGATACIVVPSFWDKFQQEGDWQKLAWWIHDHQPYSEMYFFPKLWALDLAWHERPARVVKNYPKPTGTLTAPGMANHDGSHADEWAGIEAAYR